MRIDQELSVELVGTRGRIAREAYARRRSLAEVAKHHRLHVDGRAEVVRDVIHAPVVVGAGIVPRPEDRVTGHLELLLRVLREVLAK